MAIFDKITADVDAVKDRNDKLERVRTAYNALSPEKRKVYAQQMQYQLMQDSGNYISAMDHLAEGYKSEYGTQRYRTAEDASKYVGRLAFQSRIVSQRAQRYSEIMDIYGADMDEDFRNEFGKMLDETRSGLYQLQEGARQNRDFYSQFADEDEYNLYQDYIAHPEKYKTSDEPVYYNNLGEEVDVENDPTARKWKTQADYENAAQTVEQLEKDKSAYLSKYDEDLATLDNEAKHYASFEGYNDDPQTRAAKIADYDRRIEEMLAQHEEAVKEYDAKIEAAKTSEAELDQINDEAWRPYKTARADLTWARVGEFAKRNLIPFGFVKTWADMYNLGKDALTYDKESGEEPPAFWKYSSPAVQEAAQRFIEQGGDPNADVVASGVAHYVAPFIETGRVAGELIDKDKDFSGWEETADKFQATGDKWLAEQTAGRTGFGKFVMEMGDQAVPLAVESGLSSIPYVGKTLGTASFLGRSFGSGAMEARHAGADLDGQLAYGALSAAIEGGTEALFGAVGRGFLGTAATDSITKHFVGKLFKTKAGQSIARVLVAAFGEGLEEVLADIMYPAAKSVYNGKTVKENYEDTDWSESLYSFAMGAALGGFGGGSTVLNENINGMEPKTRFFMEAGANGVKYNEALAEWRKSGLETAKATGSGETYDKALRYEKLIDEGNWAQKLFLDEKIEKLNQRAVNELSNEDIANTARAVQSRLTELGVEAEPEWWSRFGNGSTLAQAVTAVALEREAARVGANAKDIRPTKAQRKMVAESKVAQRVLSEMDVENMRREAAAEYQLTALNAQGKASKADYDRIMPQFFRTNEWVKNMDPNKLLAADVYGEKSGTITVSAEEKLNKIKVGNKELYVVGVEDGKIRLKQGAKGKAYKNIAVEDIEGISDSYRMLLTAAAARESGSAMLAAYRPGQDLVSFVRAWDLADQVYGKLTNITFAQARKAFNLRALSDVQLQAALEQGRKTAPKTSTKITKQEVSGTLSFWEGGKLEGVEYDATSEAEARKLLGDDEVDFVKNVLSKVADVTLVKSKADAEGNFTGAQGIFYEDGRIYLDVNAGLNSADVGQRTIILTAAHEMTHYIRRNNEAAYAALRDFVVAELTAQGQNIEDLMLEKQARSAEDLSDDAALEEVIADSCEMMFTDVSKVKAFASAHEAEARTIWKWLDKFLSNMKERFSGLTAAHREAAAMMDKIDEMRRIWFKALGEIQTGEASVETAKQEGGVDSIVDEIEAVLPGWEMEHPEGKKAKATVKLSAREVTDAIDVETGTKTISEDMTEEERYEVLKDKKITVYPYNPDRFAELQKNDYEELNKLLQGEYFGKTRAFNLLRTLGKNFKTFKDYFNKDILVTFEYSISSLRHSNNKQEASETASLAKLFTVFDQVIENAVGIEAHGDRYNYTKRVKSSFEKMYVLFSAYKDGQEIIPVRAEVNIYSDKTQPKLDVVVTMSKINEADVIRDTILGESTGNSSPRSASTYMVADLLQNVNPEDTGLLKYIPDGFLDEQKLLGKQKGLEDTEEYKAKKEERKAKKSDRDINTFITKADIDAEISHVQDQIRDIQNAQWNAVETAKKDPRVQDAQQKMWAAEDSKGYSGAMEERMTYRRILKEVKEELAAEVPQGDLQELADRVNELKALREQYLKVTPITATQYNKLAKHFGTTDDYGVAGFILQDGRMLDFSGKKQYGNAYAGGREVYHNEVGDVLNLPTDTSPRIDMVSNGNIRLVPEINGINLSQKPTAAQKAALRGFIDYNEGSVHVDIDNAAGRTVESFGYYKGTSASKVLADIDRYFATGETPAPQSDLRAFHSDRDIAYAQAAENNDMNNEIEATLPAWERENSAAIGKDMRETVLDEEGGEEEPTPKKRGKHAERDNTDPYNKYDRDIKGEDVRALRTINNAMRLSVNNFTREDLIKTKKWAHKYYQQLGEKSPFFRAWFGEWRAHDNTPIKIASIPGKNYTDKSVSQYTSEKKGYYEVYDTRKTKDAQGWMVRVSHQGPGGSYGHARQDMLSVIGLSGLDDLLHNSVLLQSETHEVNHSGHPTKEQLQSDMHAFDHKLYALGKNSFGEIALYKITVEDLYEGKKNQNSMIFHNLRYVEKVAVIEPGAEKNVTAESNHGLTNSQEGTAETAEKEDSTVNYTVADLYRFVKKYDNKFEPNLHDSMLSQIRQNPASVLKQAGIEIPANMRDPNQIINYMIQSGQRSPSRYQQAVQMLSRLGRR